MQNEINDMFINMYGKTKSQLLDSWLEMDSENLIQQCKKYYIQHSDKHIDNIQALFDYVKKVENDFQNEINAQQTSNKRLWQRQQHESRSYDDKNTQSNQQQDSQSRQNPGENMFSRNKQKDKTGEETQNQPRKSGQGQLTLQKDIQQAKDSLNEQLQKILAKRRRFGGQEQQDTKNKINQTTTETAEIRYEGTLHEGIQNPFKSQSFIKTIQKRGSFIPEVQAALPAYKAEDQLALDKILSLTNEELNEIIKKATNNKHDTIIGQLNFNDEDFEKVSRINKKKSILYLQQIQQNVNLNLNIQPLYKDSTYFEIMKQNYYLLNEQSREQVKLQLGFLMRDRAQRLQVLKDLNQTFQLVNYLQQFNSSDQELARKMLIDDYFGKNNAMYQELNEEKAFKLTKIINFIQGSKASQIDQNTINQIKENHHTKIKGIFTKETVQSLNFDQQYELLISLPEINEQSQQKSLPHLLLSEILSHENFDKWQIMPRDQVFNVIEKCVQMQKCRDLQNKLRGNLLGINSSQMTIKDITKICELLCANGKQGQIDSKIVQNLFMKRSMKTVAYFPNSNELSDYIDFFELLYKNSPICYSYLPLELKYVFYRLQELHKMQYLNLNDMVRFSKLVIPSLYSPTFLFKDMIEKDTLYYDQETKQIESQQQSFKFDTNLDDTYQLVDETIKRVEENTNVFDHLQLSNSRMHRFYEPFKDKTFMLWWKIVDDLISEGSQNLSQDEIRVINRIFSNEKVITNFFTDSEHIQRVIQPLLEQSIEHSKDILSQINEQPKIYENVVKNMFEDQTNQMKALENILHMSRYSETLNQVNKITENLFGQINQIIYKANSLLIDDIFKVFYQMQSLLDKIKELTNENKQGQNHSQQLQNYDELTRPVKEIVQASIEYFYDGKRPYILNFDHHEKNMEISKCIQEDTNQFLIDQNVKSIISFLSHANIEDGKQLALKFCQNLKNSRALVGKDLIQLYNMIDKYGIIDNVKTLMVNTAANLQTIERPKISRESADNDSNFEIVNRKIEDKQYEIKKNIIKKFAHLQQTAQNNPIDDPLRKEEAILGPLSKIMADVMDAMDHEEILTCLKILGNQKVDNYHEDFIKKLYEKYGSITVIDNMFEKNSKLFFKLAKAWPYFLRNNSIMQRLLSIKGASALPKQQSEILGILTQQNVLHPELMQSHFDTFIKMKDKESVSNYLKDFLHYSAYLGYDNFDIEKCVQVFRRIHHTPEQVPDIKQTLDLLLLLAMSGTYYKDFDDKSVKFIEAAIDLVDQKFQGLEKNIVEIKDQISGEITKKELQYYKSIPSTDKIYHKQQMPGNYPKFNTVSSYDKFMNEFDLISDDERLVKVIKEDVPQPLQQQADIPPTMIQEVQQKIHHQRHDEKQSEPQSEEDFEEEIEAVTSQPIDSKDQEELKVQFKPVDEQIVAQNQHSDLSEEEEFDDGQEKIEGIANVGEDKHKQKLIQQMAEKKHLHIYDRKASEALYSEELEFHQYRKKKLENMDKKSKHLLLFSNINQLNFVDINKQDIVKAWTILYHFKSKSQDSVLFDEFESITMRNSINKSKGHELFAQFYLKLVDWSYRARFRLQLAHKCQKTGWPIDVTLTYTQPQKGGNKNISVLFLLQEELCLNSKSFQEEPLGLQKLMIKHLKSFGDTQILTISENEYFANKDDKNWVQLHLMDKLGVKYNPNDSMDFLDQDLIQINRQEFNESNLNQGNKQNAFNQVKQNFDDMFGDVDENEDQENVVQNANQENKETVKND